MKRRLYILTLCLLAAGCETRRVEYHKRPVWARSMDGNMPESTITADGTEIRWIDDRSRELQGFEQTIGGEQVLIRTEQEDGTVELQCVLPMHLVVNLLECLRRGEYQVIYDQLISSEQRSWYEEEGDVGYERFEDWFQQNLRSPDFIL